MHNDAKSSLFHKKGYTIDTFIGWFGYSIMESGGDTWYLVEEDYKQA